ncbi:protein GVQW3 [Trichonephila clavipes]|nr:protein GVQW3 [Trichonephila clavipes]
MKLEKTATETYDILKQVCVKKGLSRACVFEWFKRVQNGREDVKDDSRRDYPFTSKTDHNFGKTSNLVPSDHQLSTRAIVKSVGTNKDYARELLYINFVMQKVCAEMVPKILTFELQEALKRVCTDTLNVIENDPKLLKSTVTCEES